MVRKSDKHNYGNRVLYALAEVTSLSDYKAKKTELVFNYALAHPATQVKHSAPQPEASGAQAASAAANDYNIKGVGSFLTIGALRKMTKSNNVMRISAEAINVRSAAIAKKFGAKKVAE